MSRSFKKSTSQISLLAFLLISILGGGFCYSVYASEIFSEAVNYGVDTSPRSVTSADFNGDTRIDLVTANFEGSNVSILLGNGDGTFQPAVNYGVGGLPRAPVSVTSADFNADSKIDLAVANQFGNAVSILLGNGDGTFQNAVNYGVGSLPQAVTSADFNGDSKIDLAVADAIFFNVWILLGNGDGTFQAAVNYKAGLGPVSVTSADFNGDARIDLATANQFGNNVSILLNVLPTNQPPDVSQAQPSIATLWPPNHQLVPVSILGVTDPDGDPVTIMITQIRQDEPVKGKGDGNTAPDATGLGTAVAQLRAERSGNGNGRVYTIIFEARDGKGGLSSGFVTVGVPHDQGKGQTAINDGPLFDSTQ